MACISACPNGAIEVENGKMGFPVPKINNQCKDCGACLSDCPMSGGSENVTGFEKLMVKRKTLNKTVSKRQDVLLSSASADRDFKMPKNPGTMRFSGVFLFVLFWLNLTQPNCFYRGQLGDNSPFFVFMGQLRGQPRGQLLGILG